MNIIKNDRRHKGIVNEYKYSRKATIAYNNKHYIKYYIFKMIENFYIKRNDKEFILNKGD